MRIQDCPPLSDGTLRNIRECLEGQILELGDEQARQATAWVGLGPVFAMLAEIEECRAKARSGPTRLVAAPDGPGHAPEHG